MEIDQVLKIVILDENAEVQKLFADFFKHLSFETYHFTNPRRFLDSIEERKNEKEECFDVLFTDYNFKKMANQAFKNEIQLLDPNLLTLAIHEKGKNEINFPVLLINIHQQLADHQKKSAENSTIVKKVVESFSRELIARNENYNRMLVLAKKAARSHANILINGESGTGKEVIAKFVHESSLCCSGPFVAINCSAIPENLLESELFGHAKGSFTGAFDKKIGLFEEAQGGTLFLDEIGDLGIPLQAKLLRVLQERKIRRVGENVFRDINCRIISATHKNLSNEVKNYRFREDLFYRLNVIPILIPSLRDRPEDILPIALQFVEQFCAKNKVRKKELSKKAEVYLLKNRWRGNIRELENQIERAVILNDDEIIETESFLADQLTLLSENAPEGKSSDNEIRDEDFHIHVEDSLPCLDEVLRQYVAFSVVHNHGAKDRTAKELGIDRKTLYKWLEVKSKGPLLRQ